MLRILTLALLAAATPALAQHATPPHHHMPAPTQGRAPTEPGQSTFAAIQEIVQILEADPRTDWSKVDIEALRQHLIDMNNVTLNATTTATPIENGIRFDVKGTGPTRESIRRMTAAHAATMTGTTGWAFTATTTDDGATLTVTTPQADLPKLRALGFIGVMTHGMHHQAHHLMIARGAHPHG